MAPYGDLGFHTEQPVCVINVWNTNSDHRPATVQVQGTVNAHGSVHEPAGNQPLFVTSRSVHLCGIHCPATVQVQTHV